jgi:hypothetical protein
VPCYWKIRQFSEGDGGLQSQLLRELLSACNFMTQFTSISCVDGQAPALSRVKQTYVKESLQKKGFLKSFVCILATVFKNGFASV